MKEPVNNFLEVSDRILAGYIIFKAKVKTLYQSLIIIEYNLASLSINLERRSLSSISYFSRASFSSLVISFFFLLSQVFTLPPPSLRGFRFLLSLVFLFFLNSYIPWGLKNTLTLCTYISITARSIFFVFSDNYK